MNLLPAFTGPLLGRFRIRIGTADDIRPCQQLAWKFPSELGKVHPMSLREAVKWNELYVATIDNTLVGFVRWHGRRDGWNTVRELCVSGSYHGWGIGRALLYAVPCPVRLKCTTDNPRANAFYLKSGMRRVGVDPGKKRPLFVYERRLLFVQVAGGNERFVEPAREGGAAYGTRHDRQPHDWPFMVDIRYSAYDWQDYLRRVHLWRPVVAMVPDYQEPNEEKLRLQIACLKALGVLRVMVCPKFVGAIKHIPLDCIVAISMPTGTTGDYSGWEPPQEDVALLRGRKVHLLGGTPHTQWRWIRHVASVGGTVVSVDGNSHESAAKRGTFFLDGRWYNPSGQAVRRWDDWLFAGEGKNYRTMALSLRTMNRWLNRVPAPLGYETPQVQLALF